MNISNLHRTVLFLFVLPSEGLVNVALREYEANRCWQTIFKPISNFDNFHYFTIFEREFAPQEIGLGEELNLRYSTQIQLWRTECRDRFSSEPTGRNRSNSKDQTTQSLVSVVVAHTKYGQSAIPYSRLVVLSRSRPENTEFRDFLVEINHLFTDSILAVLVKNFKSKPDSSVGLKERKVIGGDSRSSSISIGPFGEFLIHLE